MNTYQNLFESILLKKEKELLKDGNLKGAQLIRDSIGDLYKSMISHSVNDLYDSIRMICEEGIVEEDNYELALQNKVLEVWEVPVKCLSSVLLISEELLINFIDEEVDEEKFQLEADSYALLLKLYGKSIIITKEILTLIKGGYADGALSRWRSLHELNIVMQLLYKYYADSEYTEKIVERYLDSMHLEDAKEIRSYNNSGIESFDNDVLDEIFNKRNEILDKYGQEFKYPNMWAKPFFPTKRKILFHDLEKEADLESLNLYYFQANTQVHASVKGMVDSLSLPTIMQQEPLLNTLLTGSTKGLSLPIQLTCISLMQISVKVIQVLNSNLDGEIIANILLKFVNECKEVAYEIENQMGDTIE